MIIFQIFGKHVPNMKDQKPVNHGKVAKSWLKYILKKGSKDVLIESKL